jgi:3-hydroxypropanoate dehydrogenase
MKNITEIFLNDRTCNHFSDKLIDDKLLIKMYDIIKYGSTSANSLPLRIIFLKSQYQKDKLYTCLMEGNLDKTKKAPVIALFAYDKQFYNKLDKLSPNMPSSFKNMFAGNHELTKEHCLRNSSLQAAYFMTVAKAFGLAVGPMSGFSQEKLNSLFFVHDDYEINFICSLGYRSEDEKHPRLPRLSFEEACKIL